MVHNDTIKLNVNSEKCNCVHTPFLTKYVAVAVCFDFGERYLLRFLFCLLLLLLLLLLRLCRHLVVLWLFLSISMAREVQMPMEEKTSWTRIRSATAHLPGCHNRDQCLDRSRCSKTIEKIIAFDIYLPNEIDASRFSGPELFFAGAPYSSLRTTEIERRFFDADPTDADAWNKKSSQINATGPYGRYRGLPE